VLSNVNVWSDDAIRDAMVSGHVSELSGLEELERRHPSSATRPPTPFELFGR
jgi:hypothetical protein